MNATAVLLVHGIDSRDDGAFRSCSWGRIPGALKRAGHPVVFGHQDAWGTPRSNAQRLVRAITFAAKMSPDGQVIVVAHSKGGLDCLEACKDAETAAKVRALITLATPHKGMAFCDKLLGSRFAIPLASRFVNAKAKHDGDSDPDSLGALASLSARRHEDAEPPVKLISVGFASRQPKGIVARIVERTDGANDGLVPLSSTQAGDWRVARTIDPKATFLHTDCTDDHGRDLPLVLDGTTYPSIVELIGALVEKA